MMLRVAMLALSLLIPFGGMAQPFEPVWTPQDLAQADSCLAGERIVGTHYFYWYDYPHEHFYDNAERTDDALQDHFPNPQAVSYKSTDWHANEMADLVAAGIDFILPVYWGTVDNYYKKGVRFSVEGLGPLQRALEERLLREESAPKIGLFFDTSLLLPGVRGETGRSDKYDLRTPEGKDIFYRTIRDFFHMVRPRHWATIDGKPIVVLYGSGFVSHHDQSTFDYVYEQFRKDFHGRSPYIIRDNSWNAETEAVTQWGAALGGPYIYTTVAQIGPGYNDKAVPGRSTPIREREGGNFYRDSWNQVLESEATIVLLETWNEMHEGTSLCESVEYGRDYIRLTKELSDRFREGLPPREQITLAHPDPLPRPPSTRGSQFAGQASVRFKPGDEQGLWLERGQPDGAAQILEQEGVSVVTNLPSMVSYLYFSIADPFAYDISSPVEITYTYWDDGFSSHEIQYDSHDRNATLNGAYTSSGLVGSTGQAEWQTRTIRPDNARFANRQNGGTDFRFAIHNGLLRIRDIEVHVLDDE